MRIAVVGGGVSGLVCAYLLQACAEVTLFESADRLGGHTNTVRLEHEGRGVAVDTGFIVFNERNYPAFCRLLARLGVASQPSTMSFSVSDPETGFEFGGGSIEGLLARGRNLLSPRFWRVAQGVVRLGRAGGALLRSASESDTLADIVARGRFSKDFVESYLLPMAAAIWSAPPSAALGMPARFFLSFFDNHGMLDLRERPRWRTVTGGSDTYIRAMARGWRVAVRTSSPVDRVRRGDGAARVHSAAGWEAFDEVVLACHADEALAVLDEPCEADRDVLGAMPYQANEAVLHRDNSLLPRCRAAWSGWNYRLGGRPDEPVRVTYDLTILQALPGRAHLCVTLNGSDAIDPASVLGRWTYRHPIYTREGVPARFRWNEISGHGRVHFCGAYWGNGFHEDGVASALRVCERFGVSL